VNRRVVFGKVAALGLAVQFADAIRLSSFGAHATMREKLPAASTPVTRSGLHACMRHPRQSTSASIPAPRCVNFLKDAQPRRIKPRIRAK
jgi:hypothetical protein